MTEKIDDLADIVEQNSYRENAAPRKNNRGNHLKRRRMGFTALARPNGWHAAVRALKGKKPKPVSIRKIP